MHGSYSTSRNVIGTGVSREMTLLQRMARATFSSQAAVEPRRRLRLGRWLVAGASASYAYYLYENYSDAKQKEATTGIPAHKVSSRKVSKIRV